MVSRLLKLDDVRHIESPEKIAFLFQKLGYNASAQQLAVDDLELSPRSAEAIWKAHLIADEGKGALQVLLFQLQAEEFSSPAIASNRMRAIAQSLGRRPSNFLLLGTRDYNQLMLVNPRKSFDAQMNLKTSIRKLLIDRTNPTNYDRDRLEAIAARDLDPEKLYKAQCEAFDVEKLTKQFYTGYEKLFDSVQKVVQQHNPHPYFEDPSRLHQFTQRLLGRTMFLYFLQKKEFLGGDRNFLTTQYRKLQCTSDPEGTEFYSKLLEPLFFETLNKQRPNLDSDWGQIPYLNGGLFDWDYGPGIQDTAGRSTPNQIQLPNSLFDSGSANGILGFFNGYNFTVAENVQGDEDVAVDPEMLGKVFENLLAKEERGQSGTFYTPRGIVHFMCVESLSRYLADSSGISLDAIKQLVELDPDSPEITFNQLLSKEQARALKQALDTVKICDPAVGSGAFPLGMMQVILAVRQAIARREGMTVQRGSLMMSQWKRDIIANNLYGVDIKPEAIEIAKLRMWLSLVVDVPNIEDLEPLPNLDYKLMCGDSLISTINGEQLIPDPTKDQQLALNITPVQAAIQPLLKLQQQYYSAQYEERKILRQQIIEAEKNVFRVATADRYQFWNIRRRKLEQDIRYMSGANRTQVKEQQIIAKKLAELEKFTAEVERGERSLNFFQFHLHFNDVFQEKGGFDIVIGNPPYISHDKISVKDDIKSNYQAYEPFADIYCYFIERAIKLQNSKGLLSLITSNSYLKAEYGAPIRKLIKDENFILKLINLEDSQIFSDAIVNVAILLSSKLLSSVGYDCRIVNSPFSNNSQFSDFIKNNENIYNSFPLDSGVWSLVDPKFINLKNKIDKSGKTLEQLGARIKLGLATGSNEAFIITESMKKDLCEKSEVNSSIIKPILRGRDIARYSYSLPNLYILLTKNGIDVRKDYPDIYQHLDSFGEKFKTRGAKGQHWTNLRACSFFDDFAQEKIVWMELTDSAKFTLCTEEIYLLNSAYFLTTPTSLPIKYLLGILNSNVIQFYLSLISETSGVGTNRWINNHVKNFPIPRNNNLIEKQIILIVEKLLAIKNNDPESNIDELENKLNHLVYELYGLNTEEVSMIEKSI